MKTIFKSVFYSKQSKWPIYTNNYNENFSTVLLHNVLKNIFPIPIKNVVILPRVSLHLTKIKSLSPI